MEGIATFKKDVWGREVLLGVSWDLLWVVVALSFAAIALHAIVVATRTRPPRPSSAGPRVVRHRTVDRVFHWGMAASVLALLATGVLPIVGIDFPWLVVHWWAGLALTAVVLFHIVQSTLWRRLRSMWVYSEDLREPFDANKKPGKYSLAQKAMHAAVTVLTLLVVATGLVMFAMIDTPFWDRSNAIAENVLGWVFFLHGLSTLGLIAVIALHVYFAIRPEKRFYTRSMISGWISEDELKSSHDRVRWATDDNTLES